MHFHLPRPLHGWREFAGEVGIIVLGVLIALGAEQAVERVRWNREVAETRRSLAVELAEARAYAAERVITGDCIERQLLAFDKLADAEQVPAVIQINLNVGLRPWSVSAWEAASASGEIDHMSQEERNQYASVYGSIKVIRAVQLQEFETSNDLGTLVPGRHLTPISRDRLQTVVARLRGFNELLRVSSQQLIDQTTGLGVHLDIHDPATLDLIYSARRRARSCPLTGGAPVSLAVQLGKAA